MRRCYIINFLNPSDHHVETVRLLLLVIVVSVSATGHLFDWLILFLESRTSFDLCKLGAVTGLYTCCLGGGMALEAGTKVLCICTFVTWHIHTTTPLIIKRKKQQMPKALRSWGSWLKLKTEICIQILAVIFVYIHTIYISYYKAVDMHGAVL